MLYLFNIFGLQEEIILNVPRGQSPGRVALTYLSRTGWSDNVLRNMYYGRGFFYYQKNEVEEDRWNAARQVKEEKTFDEEGYKAMLLSYWKQ